MGASDDGAPHDGAGSLPKPVGGANELMSHVTAAGAPYWLQNSQRSYLSSSHFESHRLFLGRLCRGRATPSTAARGHDATLLDHAFVRALEGALLAMRRSESRTKNKPQPRTATTDGFF